jgi:hypothetical protein
MVAKVSRAYDYEKATKYKVLIKLPVSTGKLAIYFCILDRQRK